VRREGVKTKRANRRRRRRTREFSTVCYTKQNSDRQVKTWWLENGGLETPTPKRDTPVG